MIDNYNIKLLYNSEEGFHNNPGYRLYSCLMEFFPEKLCDSIHDNSKTPFSQNILYDNSKGTAIWQICSYDSEITNSLDKVLKENTEVYLKNDDITLKADIVDKSCINGFGDIRKLSSQIAESRSISLCFRTTTSLKKNGEYMLFPDLDLIIDNLWKQWNNVFPNTSFEDDDLLDLLKRKTFISSYDLKSSCFKMKGSNVKGFYGKITVTNKLSPPLKEILASLLIFSQYNGIGIKNALGMGKTTVVVTR